jgi:hypothetical protein
MRLQNAALFCFLLPAVAPAQNTFWSTSTVPLVPSVTNDSSSVTLGLPFYTSVPGTVLGIRFYKGSNNPGPHTVALYSAAGAILAQGTTTSESSTGWQTVLFPSPIPVTARTTYTVAYLASKGGYADDQNYTWPSLSRPPLHVVGPGGVFAYGSSLKFPNQVWNRSNYYVDVLLKQGPVPPPPPTPTPGVHSVTLSWTASVSPNIQGYNAYRAQTTGGPYTKINSTLISGVTYLDNVVTAGATYFYVTTAVNSTGAESGHSNEARALVPSP